MHCVVRANILGGMGDFLIPKIHEIAKTQTNDLKKILEESHQEIRKQNENRKQNEK